MISCYFHEVIKIILLSIASLFLITSWAQKEAVLKGYFFVKKFENKINKQNGTNEYYFRSGGDYYFIKNCTSEYKVSDEQHLQKAMVKVFMENGALDICDDSSLAQSRYGQFISIKNALTDKDFDFTICDINGNCLSLRGDSLIYTPIQKEVSSSGTYSGGKERREKIDYNRRISLIRRFQKAFARSDKAVFEKREKGTVFIHFNTLDGDKKYVSRDAERWSKFIQRAL